MTAPAAEHESPGMIRPGVAGAPNTNRTCDLPLRRGLLYPLSYRGDARILAYITTAYHLPGYALGRNASPASLVAGDHS